eukprot:418479_1
MALYEQKDEQCPECAKAWENIKDKPLDTKIIVYDVFYDRTITIRVNLDYAVWMIKQKAAAQLGSIFNTGSLRIKDTQQPLEQQRILRHYGSEKDWSLNIIPGAMIMCGGLKNVKVDAKNQVITVGGDQYGSTFKISSFHVSCRSDKYTGDPMVGIILYEYDGKRDWYLNGVHCKSGYIVLKLTKNIAHIKGEIGQVHGACYKWIFNESVNNKVVGGGFAYHKGKWKFNSGVFNCEKKYHDNNVAMHDIEIKCIDAAVENWNKGIQNTFVKDVQSIQSYCTNHGLGK